MVYQHEIKLLIIVRSLPLSYFGAYLPCFSELQVAGVCGVKMLDTTTRLTFTQHNVISTRYQATHYRTLSPTELFRYCKTMHE